MTLRELLKQDELRVVEVVAGADGLERTISGTVMFDNPEMVNWMRAGEIMLTAGYFLLDDPAKQEKVLRDLADNGSGGLIIKMKRYFYEIPVNMLHLADELHFPLMRIPYHTSLSEISEAVSKYVYGINEEQALQMVYQAMFDVLQGHAKVEYLLKKCGPLLHVPLLYMTPNRKIQCVSQALQPGLREELAVWQVLFSDPDRAKEAERLRAAGLSAGVYPLQQSESLPVYEQVALVREYCGTLMKMLRAKGQDRGVIFGIGDPVPSLAEFCRSYSQALRTVDLASRICDERIATYRRYILYELIYDSPNAKLALIQRIKPLLAYDEEHNTQLLYTLETYFNNCQNSVNTSKALFIHRNTLLYRLDRIAEILDLNYNDSEQMLTFQLALKAFLMCQ